MKMADTVGTDLVVVRLDSARLTLREAKTIQETKQLLDVAAAAEIYAKRQQLSEETIGYAHSIKIEALRKLGEMLKETPRAAGGQPYQKSTSTKSERVENMPTLTDLGIDRKTSSIAQKLATLPDQAFEEVKAGHIAVSKAIVAVDAGKREPAPKKPSPLEAENAQLRDEIDQLRENLPELTAMASAAQAMQDNEHVKKIVHLETELQQVKRSRDDFMRQCAELKRQVAYLQKRLKQYEPERRPNGNGSLRPH
jgi:hypothetical protein